MTTDFIVPPNPQINLSDADSSALPLQCFHLIALVEPDPESWMPWMEKDNNLDSTLETYCDLIEEELYPEGEIPVKPPERMKPICELIGEPKVIWVGGGEDADYFQSVAEWLAYVTFSNDYEAYEDLRYYIRGLVLDHPDWRVAVVGAVYEDDVMRVANAIQESGLAVTVLTRYCLSASAFVNLDDLIDLRAEMRRKGISDDDLGESF